MAYKMIGKRRVFVEDEVPQKSVQPVMATGLLAPAATQQASAGMNAAQFLQAMQPNPYGRRSDVALKALGEFAGFGGDPMSADSQAAINDIIEGNQSGRYYANEGGVNYAPELSGSLTYNQQLLDSLKGYTFNPTSDTERTGYNVTSPDGRTRLINWGTADSSFDKFMEVAIPMGLGVLTGGAASAAMGLGGIAGGAATGAIGGGVSTAIRGGNLEDVLKAAAMGGVTGGAMSGVGEFFSGAPAVGNGAFLGEAPWTPTEIPGIAFDAGAALDAYSSANPVTMADMLQTMPQINLPQISLPSYNPADYYADMPMPDAPALQTPAVQAPQVSAPRIAPSNMMDDMPGITFDAQAAIEASLAQNPLNVADMVRGLPQLSLPPIQQPVRQEYRPSKDSQQYNTDNGITQPVGTTPPRTVNLGTFDNPAYTGGTMATAGGLQGLLDVAKQNVSDTLTTPNAITGGGGSAGGALDWLKQNPAWGKLLLGGATSLLSGAGGGSGSSGSTAPSGPPVQWNSGLQQGLLSPVQQYAPAAITQNRPAGLLAQGYANDGAHRYLKG